MADPETTPITIQHAAYTPRGQQIEKFVVDQLVMVLPLSLKAGIEYGGVVCAGDSGDLQQKQYIGDPTGADPLHVYVHQDKPRCGCPEGTWPVAWYHTHPFLTKYAEGFGQVGLAWDKFIDGDLDVSEQWAIPGYVATSDGSIWRYDPPPAVTDADGKPRIINGRPALDAAGKGSYGILKPKYIPVLTGTAKPSITVQPLPQPLSKPQHRAHKHPQSLPPQTHPLFMPPLR